ncbi:hypothetical protein K1T71_015277 [Dendrolimus kikuchii]|nr:hypothetical protein K1T71_015277 [Dendrolimus kikuchii]
METNDMVKNANLRKRKALDLDTVKDLKDSLMHSFKNMLNEEITEMKQQNQKIIDTNNEILKLLQINATEINKVKEQVNMLELKYEASIKRVDELVLQIHELQKKQNNNTIEIRNIPKQDKENIEAICNQLYTILNITTSMNVFQTYRRGKNKRSPIIVSFQDIKQKEELLKAYKKFNDGDNLKLTCEHIGFKQDNSRIYISEPLTTLNKKILGAARNLVTANLYKYCWVSRGNVLLRKSDSEPAIVVKTLGQLAALREK